MRQTLHLVTRRDYALLRAAMSETNFPSESSVAKRLAPSVRALAAAGPVTTEEALALLEREHGLSGIDARRAWHAARVRAHVLHHPETALWHARPAGRFAAIEEPETHDPTEARAEILRRYFAAFGPASRRDIGQWTMMHVPELQRALDRLEPLRRFRDEQGRELFDVPGAPLPDAVIPAPVRFLPKWDNVLLAFADRTRVLPEQHRKTVIRVNGDVAQTFLVDGFVAGIWRVDDGRVALEPLEQLSTPVQREVEAEAGRLEALPRRALVALRRAAAACARSRSASAVPRRHARRHASEPCAATSATSDPRRLGGAREVTPEAGYALGGRAVV